MWTSLEQPGRAFLTRAVFFFHKARTRHRQWGSGPGHRRSNLLASPWSILGKKMFFSDTLKHNLDTKLQITKLHYSLYFPTDLTAREDQKHVWKFRGVWGHAEKEAVLIVLQDVLASAKALIHWLSKISHYPNVSFFKVILSVGRENERASSAPLSTTPGDKCVPSPEALCNTSHPSRDAETDTADQDVTSRGSPHSAPGPCPTSTPHPSLWNIIPRSTPLVIVSSCDFYFPFPMQGCCDICSQHRLCITSEGNYLLPIITLKFKWNDVLIVLL